MCVQLQVCDLNIDQSCVCVVTSNLGFDLIPSSVLVFECTCFTATSFLVRLSILTLTQASLYLCVCACTCMDLCLCECTYEYTCSASTKGLSLWGPLFSATLLWSHIVPGYRNRSSPLPLNRPKTKPCQAS